MGQDVSLSPRQQGCIEIAQAVIRRLVTHEWSDRDIHDERHTAWMRLRDFSIHPSRVTFRRGIYEVTVDLYEGPGDAIYIVVTNQMDGSVYQADLHVMSDEDLGVEPTELFNWQQLS
jgi:hypothetical protein